MEQYKETLGKQLQLLSKRANEECSVEELCRLSETMIGVVNALLLCGEAT